MFYSQVILAKKGALGKIWLAAHFEKKLTKQQIFSTDITASVETVLNPAAPLALRVSGHLMLGIVRIFSKKVRYLVSDCTEAMWKMKLAFRATSNIDLDPEKSHNIDDLKHYGNIEENYLQLEAMYFTTQVVPLESTVTRPTERLSKRSLSELFEFPSLKDADYEERSLSRVDATRGKSDEKERGSLMSISDIEIARAAEPFSIDRSPALSLSKRHSSILSAPPSTAANYGFDDDLPAFQESFDESLVANNIALAEMFVPDHEVLLESPVAKRISIRQPSTQALPPLLEEEIQEAEGPQMEPGVIELSIDQQQEEEVEKISASEQKKKFLTKGRAVEEEVQHAEPKSKPKRGRMIIDERIELSDRVVRQRIEDTNVILRRQATDEFFPSAKARTAPYVDTIEEKLVNIVPIQNLCPELTRVLNFSTNTLPLPFALKPDVAAQRKEQEIRELEKLQSESEEKKSRAREREKSKVRDRESVELARGALVEQEEGAARSRLSYDVGRLSTGFRPDIDSATKDASFFDVSPQFGDQINISGFIYDQDQAADRMSLLAGPSPINRMSYQPTDASNNLRRIIFEASPSITGASPLRPTENETVAPSKEQQKSERTERIIALLEQEFDTSRGAPLSFNRLCASAERKTAASFFLEVLQLKTWGVVDVKQSAAFDDIQLLRSHA